MIFEFIIFLLISLMVVYYVTLSLHIFDIIKLTKKKISIGKALIPFYYWGDMWKI